MQSKDDSAHGLAATLPTADRARLIEISADPEIYTHLSPQAKGELQVKLSELTAIVLKEAQSFESAHRAQGAVPDIGRWHIERSWWNIMLRYKKEKHSRWLKVLPIFSSVCLFFMGLAASHIREWWGLTVFAAGTILGAVCIAALYVTAGES